MLRKTKWDNWKLQKRFQQVQFLKNRASPARKIRIQIGRIWVQVAQIGLSIGWVGSIHRQGTDKLQQVDSSTMGSMYDLDWDDDPRSNSEDFCEPPF